jgi:hypothetical protein
VPSLMRTLVLAAVEAVFVLIRLLSLVERALT